MANWEIYGEDLLWIEVYTGIAFLIVLAAWAAAPKIPIKFISLILTIGVVGAGSLRPFDYNSDTTNYYSYVYFLRFISGNEIFFLTKLEPLHSLLILLFRDFRQWLIAESALQIVGLVLSYRLRPNIHSFVALCAFTLTLSTSSLRFTVALIWFYYFLMRADIGYVRAVRMTVILSMIHISMLLSGALALQKRIGPIAVMGLCAVIILQSALILGGRLNVDLAETSGGLKTLAVSVVPLLYLFTRQRLQKSMDIALYLGAVLALFAVASAVLFTFNRFLILATLVILGKHWLDVRKSESDPFDRALLALVGAGILAPYVIGLPKLYFSHLW